MTVRMTPEEESLRDSLAAHLGTDGSSVMRMALLKLARQEGITAPETVKAPHPKTGRGRK
jgi:hypothetical protein